MIDYIVNPYVQVFICCLIMFLTAIFTKLDVGSILSAGLYLGVLYLPVSLFYGVYFDQSWEYLLHALLSTFIFSAVWVLLSLLADKYGQKIRNGEGMMVLMVPVTLFPAIFAFAVVSKLIFDFIRWIF